MGDNSEKQFQELFKTHYEALCLFTTRFVRDKNQAEDIVQAVFSSLWEKRHSLEWGEKITHYLYRAAKNNALDYLKKNRLDTGLEESFFEQLEEESNFSRERLQSLKIAIIKRGIQTLPARCKEVFSLQKLSGLTYNEIAEELNISVKTVENQMVKALSLIRQYYDQNKDKYGI